MSSFHLLYKNGQDFLDTDYLFYYREGYLDRVACVWVWGRWWRRASPQGRSPPRLAGPQSVALSPANTEHQSVVIVCHVIIVLSGHGWLEKFWLFVIRCVLRTAGKSFNNVNNNGGYVSGSLQKPFVDRRRLRSSVQHQGVVSSVSKGNRNAHICLRLTLACRFLKRWHHSWKI